METALKISAISLCKAFADAAGVVGQEQDLFLLEMSIMKDFRFHARQLKVEGDAGVKKICLFINAQTMGDVYAALCYESGEPESLNVEQATNRLMGGFLIQIIDRHTITQDQYNRLLALAKSPQKQQHCRKQILVAILDGSRYLSQQEMLDIVTATCKSLNKD